MRARFGGRSAGLPWYTGDSGTERSEGNSAKGTVAWWLQEKLRACQKRAAVRRGSLTSLTGLTGSARPRIPPFSHSQARARVDPALMPASTSALADVFIVTVPGRHRRHYIDCM